MDGWSTDSHAWSGHGRFGKCVLRELSSEESEKEEQFKWRWPEWGGAPERKAPGSSRSRVGNDNFGIVHSGEGWEMTLWIYRQTKKAAFFFLQAVGAFEGYLGAAHWKSLGICNWKGIPGGGNSRSSGMEVWDTCAYWSLGDRGWWWVGNSSGKGRQERLADARSCWALKARLIQNLLEV